MVTITPAMGRTHITPTIFCSYASQYLTAALTAGTEAGFSPVPYYLCCHSLELSMKAFLVLKGLDPYKEIKKLGHDLEEILTKARGLGLERLFSRSRRKTRRNCLGRTRTTYPRTSSTASSPSS